MSNFEPIYGECICGSVKYSINSKPLFTQVCHCLDCKKLTGSSYVMNTSIFEDSLKIRLLAYYRDTSPLIGYYHAHNKLRKVNGLGSVDEIQSKIRNILL